LGEALASCTGERSRDGNRLIDAYLCVGEANMDERVPGHSAGNAYCAYHAAAVLAEQARSASLQSRAQVGRAQALEALRQSQEDVLEAYRLAIAADGTATTALVARARHYMGRQEWDRARDDLVTYDASRRAYQAKVSTRDMALAIVELVQRADYDGNTKIALLGAAQAAAPTSVAVNSALGTAYFEMAGQQQTALDFLRRATEQGSAEAGYEPLQEKAFLYRSMLAATGVGGTMNDALTYADRAGNTPEAMRQGCLIRLQMGGNQVFVPTQLDRNGHVTRPPGGGPINMTPAQQLPGYDHCNRFPNTAEGQLLLGMFWLRHAQYLAQNDFVGPGQAGERRWTDAVTAANRAFQQGETLVPANNTPLGWAGAGPVTLRMMLIRGQHLASYIGTICRRNEPVPSDEERVFVRYNIIRSSDDPNRTRCVVAPV
jgi:hypothetical protein